MKITIVLLTSASIACSGCASDEPSETSVLPVLHAERDLHVGSADDPVTAFTAFSELAVAPDGSMYTLHGRENAIRVHDAQGAFVRVIGREGEGPGEFRELRSLGIIGDTLWAFDSDTYRFSLFTLDGDLIRTRGFLVDLGDATRIPPRPSGLLHDGTVWGSRPAFSREIADGTLTETPLVRFDSVGRVVDTIAVRRLENSTWRLADPNSAIGFQSFRQQPFGETQLLAVSPVASEVITVDRAVEVGDEDPTFRVTRLTFDGDTVFTREFAYEPRPIPAGLPDSLARGFASGLQRLPDNMRGSAPTYDHGVELARSTLHLPPHYPPVTFLVPGLDGTIWLSREDDGSELRTYWILEPDGEPVGTVLLPRGLRVMAADRSHVWGAELDELDVPYLVRYTVSAEPSAM